MRLLNCVTPTAARTLRNYVIIDRRVREAVLVLIDWTVIAYPHPSFHKPSTGKGPRNVPGNDWGH